MFASAVFSSLLALTFAFQDLNKHLYPPKTQLIAIVNLEVMKNSGLFDKDFEEGFNRLVTDNELVQRLSKTIGFEPSKQIKSVTLCGAGPRRERESLIIVNGAFDYEKFAAELAKMAKDGVLTSMTINDLPIYYAHRSRTASYFALMDGQTIIASESKDAVEEAVQGITDLRDPPEELTERLKWKSSDKNNALVLAGVFPKEVRDMMARNPQLEPIARDLEGFGVTFSLGENSARFNGKLSMADRESARRAFETMRGFHTVAKLAMASNPRRDIAEVLDNLNLAADEADVVFSVEIPRALMETIIDNNRKDGERFREEREKRRREREGKGKAAEKNNKEKDKK